MAEDGTSTQLSTQLSPQALALYERMLEDATFIKRQQWATTVYTALIYAAIIWLARNWAIPSGVAYVLIVFSIATAAIGSYLLIWFQNELCELRKRIAAASDYAFGPNEKTRLEIRTPDPDPFWRGWQILASLISICIAGMVLAIMAITIAPIPK